MSQINLFDEIIVDNFAGGGGASTGMELASGRPVTIAINHDPDAILLHRTNHPYTEHLQTSVWDVNPIEVCKGRPVGLAWFSPDCKHFSKARGGIPVKKEIRSLAWVTVRWALEVRPRVIMLENVEEFQTWGPTMTVIIDGKPCEVPDPERTGETFGAFVGILSKGIPADHPALDEVCEYLKLKKDSPEIKKLVNGLGYDVEFKELVAADYGAPTTRKRFALVARCDGKPIGWPERTHAPRDSEEVKSGKLPPWKPAADIIDWSLPAYSIFDSKAEIKKKYGVKAQRPLAANTLRRVIRGVDKFTIKSGDPFLIECNHGGDGHIRSVREPVNTLTAKYTGGIAQPVMTPFTFANTTGSSPVSTEEPVHTITSAGNQVLASPVMAPFTFSNTGGSVGSPASEPVHTIRTAGGQILASAQLMSIGQTGGGDRIRDVRDPAPTTVSKQEACLVSAQLVEYYGNGNPLDIKQPLHTVTSRDREAIVSAHLSEFRSASIGRDLRTPAGTVTSHDHEGVVSAHIQKFYGGVVGQDAREPMPTVTAIDHNALCAAHVVKFKGQELGQNSRDTLNTITAQGLEYADCRAVLVKVEDSENLGHWSEIRKLLNEHCGYNLADDEVILLIIQGIAYYIADITLRMLTPRELYNAMGFPPDYAIERDYKGDTYPKNKQVARCGNAVCPPLAEALVRANMPEWCGMKITTMAQFENAVAM